MSKDRYQKAYSYTLRLFKSRPRSIEEVRNILKLRKYPESIIDRIINKFKDTGLLNDREFARAWVEDRMNLNPKAPRLLKLELKKKGVSEDIIEKTLDRIEKEYNFKDVAYRLARDRYQVLERINDKQKKKKRIFDYLARRGFNYAIIYKALNRIFNQNEDR